MKYTLNHDRGMTVIEAKSIRQARKYAREEYGRAGSARAKKATEEDIAWYLAMGGYIYEA